jgi:hypothetical protein
MFGMGHRRGVELRLLSVFSPLAARLLPFTVTKPVTNRGMSIAVESRVVKLRVWEDLVGNSYDVFGSCPLIADDPRHRPDIP